jgi:hypothetical protein
MILTYTMNLRYCQQNRGNIPLLDLQFINLWKYNALIHVTLELILSLITPLNICHANESQMYA